MTAAGNVTRADAPLSWPGRGGAFRERGGGGSGKRNEEKNLTRRRRQRLCSPPEGCSPTSRFPRGSSTRVGAGGAPGKGIRCRGEQLGGTEPWQPPHAGQTSLLRGAALGLSGSAEAPVHDRPPVPSLPSLWLQELLCDFPSLSCWSPKLLLEGESGYNLCMSGENFLVGKEFTADGQEESNRHPPPDSPCLSRFSASPGARWPPRKPGRHRQPQGAATLKLTIYPF